MYNYNYGYSYARSSTSDAATALIVAAVIAFIGALALSIYFLSRKRYQESASSPVKHGLFRFVNFDLYVFSSVVKFLYLFVTIFVIVGAFIMMFMDDGLLPGLAMLFAGPIVVRLMYELLYVIFSIRDQLSSINRTLAEGQKPGSDAPAPRRFCPGCGNEVKDGVTFCPNCGSKIN